MSNAKDEVSQLLQKLPDNCSLEDIQYHLYVLEKIQSGLASAASSGTVPQSEVEERLGKWLAR